MPRRWPSERNMHIASVNHTLLTIPTVLVTGSKTGSRNRTVLSFLSIGLEAARPQSHPCPLLSQLQLHTEGWDDYRFQTDVPQMCQVGRATQTSLFPTYLTGTVTESLLSMNYEVGKTIGCNNDVCGLKKYDGNEDISADASMDRQGYKGFTEATTSALLLLHQCLGPVWAKPLPRASIQTSRNRSQS